MIEHIPPKAAPSRDLMRAWLRQAETREEEVAWARRYREAVTALLAELEPPAPAAPIVRFTNGQPCGYWGCGRPVGHDGLCLRAKACARPMRGGTVCGRTRDHRWACRSVETMRADADRRSGRR